jgi:hypothetical protein
MRNPGIQQEGVTVKIKKGDAALGPVETDDYVITYFGFMTLGNTNDTVTVTLNGVTGVVLSMIGYTECPIRTIQVTDDMDSSNTGVEKGLLVFGVKQYKSIF